MKGFCSRCRFYFGGVELPGGGECRRYPPVFSDQRSAIFPIVNEGCWCGEFRSHAPVPVRGSGRPMRSLPVPHSTATSTVRFNRLFRTIFQPLIDEIAGRKKKSQEVELGGD